MTIDVGTNSTVPPGPPFNEGDLVRLVSGGLSMIVTSCSNSGNEDWPWLCNVLYMDTGGQIHRFKGIDARHLVMSGGD